MYFGWWWVVVDIFWLVVEVVNGGGWWWVVVDILWMVAGVDELWWVVVGRGGW